MMIPAFARRFAVVVVLAVVAFWMTGGVVLGQQAASQTKSVLENLKGEYAQQVQGAVKPIQDAYLAALQNLVRMLTQGKNLDAALEAQTELKNTQGAALPLFLGDVTDAPGPAAGMRSQLQMLEADYRAKLRGAIKPVEDRYLQTLNTLLNTATQKGDLDSALAVRDELTRVTKAAAAPAVAGGTNGGGAVTTSGTDAVSGAAGPGKGWYYLQAQISGLYLRVASGSHNAGAKVVQDKKQGGQLWRFIPDGKGNYLIQSQASELYLDGKLNGDSEDQVEQSADTAWQLIPDGKGGYFLRSVATGNYLNTAFWNKDIGGKIDQGGRDDKQTWKLIDEL